MLSRRFSKDMPGWQPTAAVSRDASPGISSSLKLAIVTGNEDLYRRIEAAFADDCIDCRRIDPERESIVRSLQRDTYSAVLYDIGQSVSGAQALLEWRACHADLSLPLIAMARISPSEMLQVFRAGAEDVVLHPFDLSELHARTHALLWRSGALGHQRQRIQLGSCVLDKTTRAALLHGDPVTLTCNEFTMAWLLFSKVGECVSRKQIASAVWGCTEDIVGRPLEQYIYRLRKKLRFDDHSGLRLRTVYARGYVLEVIEVPEVKEASEASEVPDVFEEHRMPVVEAACQIEDVEFTS